MSQVESDTRAGGAATTGAGTATEATGLERDHRGARLASTSSPRDIRIDSLRGLMLVEMTLVHVKCPVASISYECFGRVSPAAGFVFLSGLVAGAVYGRAAQKGAVAVIQRCLQRTGYIHAYHVVTFMILLAAALWVPRANTYFKFEIGYPPVESAMHTLGWFVVWAYQPDLFDILPLYGLFVLCMPAALLALRNQHGVAMLLVSLGVWALAQLGLGHITDGTHHLGFFQGDFNPFAWQFVFFSGLYFGHEHLYRRQRVIELRPALLMLCLLICIVGFTVRWDLLPWPAFLGPENWLASKQNYGPTYLVNFLAFACLVYYLATRLPRAFEWPALAFLGRSSIQVFSFHVLVIYLALPVNWRAAGHGPWVHNALGVVLVASLWLPAWCQSRWRRYRQLSHAAAHPDFQPSSP
jgi:hypothetical protein